MLLGPEEGQRDEDGGFKESLGGGRKRKLT